RSTASLRRLGGGFMLFMVFLYLVFPFLWAVASSLKTVQELFDVKYLPAHPHWDNYRKVFVDQPFALILLNSAVVSFSATMLTLILGSLAAFGLGRFRFRGRTMVFCAILAVAMFPQISLLGGVYLLVKEIGLYNSWSGLILSYLVFMLPL